MRKKAAEKVGKPELKVKAIQGGYFGFPLPSFREIGDVFYLSDPSEFSHLWMKAINFKPLPPSQAAEEIMETGAHKSKFEKYKPFDKKTHPTAPEVQDESEEVQDEQDDPEAEENKAKGKNKKNEDVL